MFCFALILAYPGFSHAIHTGLELIGRQVLPPKMMDTLLGRYDFVISLAFLMGTLILILSVCDSAISLLMSTLSWPAWFSFPTFTSLGFTIFVGVGVGMTWYYIEIIATRGWLKLQTENWSIGEAWIFGETRRVVRQAQKLSIGLLLGCLFGIALLEEVLWRGYLITYATDVLNLSTQHAIIISSFAFGMNHMGYGLANVLSKTLFGGILCLLYLASDSLFPSILCHQVFNLMVFNFRIERKP